LLFGGSSEGFRGCSANRSGEDSHRQHGTQEDANAQHEQEKNLPAKDRAKNCNALPGTLLFFYLNEREKN
jgi:hypothetical protein